MSRAARFPMARRVWHVRVNAFVIAWLLAAVIVAVAHQWIPSYSYLLVHLTMLGAITTAILIWSARFADNLLGRPAPGGQRLTAVRLALHTVSAIGVIVGVITARSWLVVAGAVGIVVVALVHVIVIALQRRGALKARFGALSLFYMCAGVNLALGVWFGTLLAVGAGSAAWRARLYTAHSATMLLGWVGLTVLGTLVVLWPTMLRTKMVPDAPLAARSAMFVLLSGLGLVWAGVGTGASWLLSLAALAYLSGVVMLVVPMAQVARVKQPASFATYGAIGAVCWLTACLVWLGVIGLTSPSWVEVEDRLGGLVGPFVVGFAAQILLSALSYLAPVMLGGGPRIVKRVDLEMNRAAGARVTVVNGGGALYLLPLPSLVKVSVSLLVLVGLASFLVLLGRALHARYATGNETNSTVLATTIHTGPPPTPRRLGPLTGLGALVLAVVIGMVGDAAAAGLGGAG